MPSFAWLAASLALLAPRTPDLAPPGMKTVATVVVIELAESASGAQLAISPGGGPMRVVEPGEPIRLGSYPFVRLYALAPGEALPAPADWRPPLSETWPVGRASAELPVRRAAPVSTTSPVARVVHTLRVVEVTGDGIRFELVATRRLDARGEEIDERALRLVWVGLASVGALGLLLRARRQRAAVREADA